MSWFGIGISWETFGWTEETPLKTEVRSRQKGLRPSTFGEAIRRGEDARPVPPPPMGGLAPGRAAPEELATRPKLLKKRAEWDLPDFTDEVVQAQIAALRPTENGKAIRKGEDVPRPQVEGSERFAYLKELKQTVARQEPC